MKYTVKTKYEDFEVEDRATAMSLAELMARYSKETHKCIVEVEYKEKDTEEW